MRELSALIASLCGEAIAADQGSQRANVASGHFQTSVGVRAMSASPLLADIVGPVAQVRKLPARDIENASRRKEKSPGGGLPVKNG
jgi:hypothetical protein